MPRFARAEMAERTSLPGPGRSEQSLLDGPFRLVVALAAVLALAVVARAIVGGPVRQAAVGPSPSPTRADPAAFIVSPASAAPEIDLTDQEGRPFTLAGLRGRPTLVFFGYTHCPDVCPATVGIMSQVLATFGRDLAAVFVTVDPARDTVPWLKEYVRYLPSGFSAVTGTSSEIRAVADAWGVRYARVDSAIPGEYSMAHTADVFVVGADGQLRGRFPFGTTSDGMLDFLRTQLPNATGGPTTSTLGPTPTPTPAPSATPSGSPAITDLKVEVVSSSVWAGGSSPMILAVSGPEGRLNDLGATVSVQLTRAGLSEGPAVAATPVLPQGLSDVSYVAFVDIPATGWWDIGVTLTSGTTVRTGWGSISAQDPGGTARLGAPAPTARTPTLADVGGRALAITTDPLPDLRMSMTSTADALASGKPFVLIVDSVRFRVSPICGKAVVLAKYLLDRWTGMTFIHLEPYKYDVVTDTAVLEGSLGAPTIVPAADAWGIASPPWGAASMPWVFIVDGHGVVIAKYQGILGSADVDVLLTWLQARG